MAARRFGYFDGKGPAGRRRWEYASHTARRNSSVRVKWRGFPAVRFCVKIERLLSPRSSQLVARRHFLAD